MGMLITGTVKSLKLLPNKNDYSTKSNPTTFNLLGNLEKLA
jgi:hypothetical protein